MESLYLVEMCLFTSLARKFIPGSVTHWPGYCCEVPETFLLTSPLPASSKFFRFKKKMKHLVNCISQVTRSQKDQSLNIKMTGNYVWLVGLPPSMLLQTAH